MGIVLTKYEDSANNNVVFDVSKFDYSFAEDAFPGDSQDDYSDILLEAGSDYTVTQQTTSEDSMGDVIDVVETSFTARAYLQHLFGACSIRTATDSGTNQSRIGRRACRPGPVFRPAGSHPVRSGDRPGSGCRHRRRCGKHRRPGR